MVLKYFKQDTSVPDLTYATEQSACFDIRAFLQNGERLDSFSEFNVPFKISVIDSKIRIAPGDRVKIPTGIILDIPENYCVKIYPRSSVGYKMGLSLANGTGIIDSDYVDPLYLLMVNNTNKVAEICNGDRLCQGELVPIIQAEFAVLDEPPKKKTSRDGGIGSTGK